MRQLHYPPDENAQSQLHRDISRILGAHVFDHRQGMGLTQESVAIRAGISSPTFVVLERGFARTGVPSNPTLGTLLRVLTTLESAAVESLALALMPKACVPR
jgi:transcriptional regulator with XRE-family HTH domain